MKNLRLVLTCIIAICSAVILSAQTPASAGKSTLLYESNMREGNGEIKDWEFFGDNVIFVKVTSKVMAMAPVYLTNANGDKKKVTLYVPPMMYKDTQFYRKGNKPLYWWFEVQSEMPKSQYLFEATWTPIYNY